MRRYICDDNGFYASLRSLRKRPFVFAALLFFYEI